MSFTQLLLGVGTGLVVQQQIRAGQQQQQIFEFNAAINRQKAELTKQAGKLKTERLRRQKRAFGRKQQAAFAVAGVRLTGSPLQVLADTAAELEFDIMVEDFNTRIAVLNAETSGELDIVRGQQAQSAGLINAGTTLLSQIPNFITSQNRARIV